jgi:Fic family protein
MGRQKDGWWLIHLQISMNARKYIGITKTSKATATRVMQQLLEIGAFKLAGKAGGRSTSYQVNI